MVSSRRIAPETTHETIPRWATPVHHTPLLPKGQITCIERMQTH